MSEIRYHFPNLDIHSAFIVQAAIEKRKMDPLLMTGTDKAVKAVLAELDQIYDDLDRHIAAVEREQFLIDQGKK